MFPDTGDPKRGDDPIIGALSRDDVRHVSTITDRYLDTGRRFEREGKGECLPRRAEGGRHGTTTMDARKAYVEHLRAQISEDMYEVDERAVADAIVRRLQNLQRTPAATGDED